MQMTRVLLVATLLVGSCLTQVNSMQANLAPTDLERVNVGSRPPDFLLKDLKGQPHSLKDYEKKKNVVLVFYRGHW